MADSESGSSLATLTGIFGRYAAWLGGSVCLGLAAAALYVHTAEPKYRVTLLLVPSQDSPLAKSAMGAGGLSGLASLAGVSLPGDANALPFELFPDALAAPETAASLLAIPPLMQTAFASRWDARTGQWQLPASIAFRFGSGLKGFLGYPANKTIEPNGQMMQEFIKKRVKIVRDRKRPIITLSIDHEDTQFSRSLLQTMASVTDERLKESSLKRSRENVAYLQSRLAETQNVEYRAFLLSVMAEVEKQRMASSGSMPYVAEGFGAPAVSAEPVTPNIPLAYATGALVGLLLAVIALCIRHWSIVRRRLVELMQSDEQDH